jgi:HAD superfamily hydrolase (TIGR01458 family)
MDLRAVLLDIDGVLVTSWKPIEGAAEAVEALEARGLGLRFLTNTTSRTRAEVARSLRQAGIAVDEPQVLTATLATRSHLQAHHRGARCFIVSDDPIDDLGDVALTDDPDDAEVVVLGGAGPAYTWEALSAATRAVAAGAALVAVHGSAVWQTDEGLCIDTGAYTRAVEFATDTRATVVGKPAPAMFTAALEDLGAEAAHAVMVGDDVRSDVNAAQAVGVTGVLVRTGKFRPETLDAAEPPDAVIDSVADLPDLCGRLAG